MAENGQTQEIKIKNSGKKSFFDRDITINIKFLAIFLLVTAAFLAGRFMFPSEHSLTPEITDMLSGAFSLDGVFSGSSAEPSGTAAANNTVSTTNSTINDSATATVAAGKNTQYAATSESNETGAVLAPAAGSTNNATVTGGYSNIGLSFKRTPAFDWKGTWGKIETIYYTLENNEAGSIAPYKFVVLLEGYEDPIERSVPKVDSIIEEGKTKEHGFDIGTSYSETVTDPTNIGITLQLFDKSGQLMATVEKEFNLKS